MRDGLHAAFTDVDITPDQDRQTAAGKKKDRSYPIYDPLKARILLLQDGDDTAAIVAVDGFELGIRFDEKVAAALAACGIAPFPTLFCPSHIGSTPISNYGAYIMIFAQDLIIEDYEDEISNRIAEGIPERLREAGAGADGITRRPRARRMLQSALHKAGRLGAHGLQPPAGTRPIPAGSSKAQTTK